MVSFSNNFSRIFEFDSDSLRSDYSALIGWNRMSHEVIHRMSWYPTERIPIRKSISFYFILNIIRAV